MRLIFSSIFFVSVLTFMFCITPQFLTAQPGDPCGGPNDPCDPDTPIDGGLSILIAAGVGYGFKKIRDERKKKSVKF